MTVFPAAATGDLAFSGSATLTLGTIPAPPPLLTSGGKVTGGTVTMVADQTGSTGPSSPTTTGGVTTGATMLTTGGTTTAGTATATVSGADYDVHPNYCKLGWYPGYIIGTGGTGDLLKALNSLETLIGQKIEVFSRGLPNNMGDCTNALLQAQGCPQLGVWAMPIVPMSGGSITRGLAGDYDALIDATADAFIAHRPKDVVRCGWEFTGPNYAWGVGHPDPGNSGIPNTLADVKAMQQRVMKRMRDRGFQGYFDINGGSSSGGRIPVDQWFSSEGDIIGYDCYAVISDFTVHPVSDVQGTWDDEIKPALDELTNYARAHGKYCGMAEAGVLHQDSKYKLADNSLFWQLLQAYLKANCDVWLYVCTWNENQKTNGVITEEGKLAYSGNITGQTTDTLHDTSTHGPWVWTPSPYLQKSLAGWRQYMKTGSMTNLASATLPTTTGGTSTNGVTTGGVTQMPNGSTVTNGTVTGGVVTGGTVVGGTLQADGSVLGGTSTGGTVTGGTVAGGTLGYGGYSGGTRQADGTYAGGTLVGGVATGGVVTGGLTQLPDGSTVINGTVIGGTTYGGTTVGGIFDPTTGTVVGGTTTGGTTVGGSVSGGVVVPPGGSVTTQTVTPLGSGAVGVSGPQAGLIGWDYSGPVCDGFKVVAFANGPQALRVVYDVPYASGRVQIQTDIGDVTQFGWVVYPYSGSDIGQGGLYTEGWFLDPPTAGSPPLQSSPPAPGSVTVTNTTTGVTTALNPTELAIGYSNTSNWWYVGGGEDVSVYGHTPRMALDDDDNSYWLSIGNAAPTADNAFEWYEVTIPRQEVTSVRFHNVGTGYFVYVSVFAAGVWVAHNPGDIIPYNAADPTSHNGANIPFCETINCGTNGDGPYEVVFRAPIPAATRIRITYHALQPFPLPLAYRAALRKIKVFGLASSGTGTTTTTTTTIPFSPIHDYDSPDVLQSYTTYIPPVETPGAGEKPGTYEDYTDIVKLLCAWGGFYWPPGAVQVDSSGNTTHYDFGGAAYGLLNTDPVLGGQDGGRVWGDFANTGVAGIANLPVPQWDKKSLLDCISYVRDIIGFVFFIDETGGVVWRLPNLYSVGNYFSILASPAGRSSQIVTIDDRHSLMDLRATLSSRNVRERFFVASTDGKTGSLAAGYNANPTGLRRIAGWTDQHFATDTECLLMADTIALRALMSYRVDTVQIPGYPRIQVDDQVQINERVTKESYLHYVRGISSSLDHETGLWTYDLDTNWLGTDPFNNWVFNVTDLSAELQAYLTAVNALNASTTDPATTPTTTTTQDVTKVAKLVKVSGDPAVYITDGITKRHVIDQTELQLLVSMGLVPSATPSTISSTVLGRIPDAP